MDRDRSKVAHSDHQAALKSLHELLGFTEDEHLRALHAEVVTAIRAGHSAPRRQAWLRYVEAADPQVDFPDDGPRNTRARAGLAIAQALIHEEAGQTVEYLTQLLAAEAAAAAGQWVHAQAVLERELSEYSDTPRYIQAQANFETDSFETARMLYDLAIGRYSELEATSDPVDLEMRGILNLRMAECYNDILRLEADGLVELVNGDVGQLQHLLFDSLRTAALYLEINQPERAMAMGMMDDLQQNEWWTRLIDQ